MGGLAGLRQDFDRQYGDRFAEGLGSRLKGRVAASLTRMKTALEGRQSRST